MKGSANSENVKAIVCARASTNVSELRGLLGLVQYVGRYVPGLATVDAVCLREVTALNFERLVQTLKAKYGLAEINCSVTSKLCQVPV